MRSLLLLILMIALWGAGVAGCFLAGGVVTFFFRASDLGLILFVIASVAWTAWLGVQISNGIKRS